MALRTRLPRRGDRVRLASTGQTGPRYRYGTVLERDDVRSLALRVAWDGTAPRHRRTEAWLPQADLHWHAQRLTVVSPTEGLAPRASAVPATPKTRLGMFQGEEDAPRLNTPAQDSADQDVWSDEAWLDEALAAMDRGAAVSVPTRTASTPTWVEPAPSMPPPTAAARLFQSTSAPTKAPAPETPWNSSEDLLPAKRGRRSRLLQHR